MQKVRDYLASLNFNPPDFTPDGKIHRFSRNGSKDSAWYIAWQNAMVKNGEFYYVCSFGDWKTGEKHLYKPDGLSRADKKIVDEQILEQQKKAEEDLRALNIEVAIVAEKRYAAAKKFGTTPYLERKQLAGLHGACLYEDRVQVPMVDVKGKIWNLQSIFPDGQKRFMAKGRKKGCFHVMGGPITSTVFLCEGFATGASIREATVGETVVVAFDAGNLVEVARELRAAYSDLFIKVCGDDDRSKEPNVGREKAEKAALICQGAIVFPEFPADDVTSTDFNDLHVSYGLEAVRNQLVEKPPERNNGFIPLGYEEGVYFFYHIPSKDIVRVSTFSPIQMYRLAPMDYWEANYPTKKGGADLNRAAHDLIQISTQVGPFDSSRIRGTGVWLDGNRVVINTGHNLLVDKVETALTALNSWQIYIQTKNRIPRLHPRILTAAEGESIVKICSRFNWENYTDSYLLCGWLALARIAGALPIRPHIWLTGGKGTGKSTLMEQFIAPLLGTPKGKVHVVGSTTEAGLRQDIKVSSLPIIFDEFESTGRTSKERVESIIELLRGSWSATQGRVIKGSSGGSSVEYQLSFAAMLSSIRVKLDNDADRSRFSVLELGRHNEDPEQWRQLRASLATLSEETGERLFARACEMFPITLRCQEIISRYLAIEVSQRYGQQVGSLLGAWWTLVYDEPIDEEAAESLCRDFVQGKAEESREELTDEIECLMVLTTRKFDLRDQLGYIRERTLEEVIRDADLHQAIRRYGVKIENDRFIVAYNHAELEKIYQGTRWAGNWARPLLRLKGAERRGMVSFGSRESTSRCVSIPKHLAE